MLISKERKLTFYARKNRVQKVFLFHWNFCYKSWNQRFGKVRVTNVIPITFIVVSNRKWLLHSKHANNLCNLWLLIRFQFILIVVVGMCVCECFFVCFVSCLFTNCYRWSLLWARNCWCTICYIDLVIWEKRGEFKRSNQRKKTSILFDELDNICTINNISLSHIIIIECTVQFVDLLSGFAFTF